MNHHGKLLRSKMQAKGLDIQGLANALEQHRVTVESDLRKEQITQKVLKKYGKILDLTIEDFYPGTGNVKPTTAVQPSESVVVQLLRELVEEQRKRLDLQDQMIRFFPNAVQMA